MASLIIRAYLRCPLRPLGVFRSGCMVGVFGYDFFTGDMRSSSSISGMGDGDGDTAGADDAWRGCERISANKRAPSFTANVIVGDGRPLVVSVISGMIVAGSEELTLSFPAAISWAINDPFVTRRHTKTTLAIINAMDTISPFLITLSHRPIH